MVNDPIADMFSRIMNALAVRKETVSFPHSRIKMEIAKILANEKFIKEVDKKSKKNKKMIEMILFYDEKGRPIIKRLKRISKPSQRIYVPFKKLGFSGKFGMQIISTNKGIMTSRDAKKQKVGGEIICEVN